MATLGELEQSTKHLADARELLKLRVENLQHLVEQLKREHMPAIKEAVGTAANAKGALVALIEDSRPLFVKPKSIIISGIRIGLKKGTGSVEWEDEALVIERLKKIFKTPEEQEIYIKTKETVRKKPLEELDAATLKKIGVTIEGNGEVVLIKFVDSDVDKIVNALLKESAAESDEMEEAA